MEWQQIKTAQKNRLSLGFVPHSCGGVVDKAKVCAEIEHRELIIASRQQRIDALLIAEDARALVAGRTLKFAMDRGYNPASDENELEYIMRRFDEMAHAMLKERVK